MNKDSTKHFYTKMKVFHFKEKIDSLTSDTDNILPPLHIRIKPMNGCNHNCWYCAYRADNLQLGKDMNLMDFIPKEKMLEIIDDIAEMEVKAVTFSGGGEPFLYPYLLGTVRKLSLTPVKFSALTHGALLEGELAEIFAHKGTWLRISMDGWDDESYSSHRKVRKGEFTRVLQNMKAFKKLGGSCFLGVSLVVDKANAFHLYDLIGLLRDVGVDSVKVSPCIVSNDANENAFYHKGIFSRVKDEIQKSAKDFAGADFEIYDAYVELNQKFEKDYEWCPYLQIAPVIGADLNVYACHDKAYNLDQGLLGSIKDCRFKEFWLRDKQKFFKIRPSLHCKHHCVVNINNKLILDYLNTDKQHLEFV